MTTGSAQAAVKAELKAVPDLSALLSKKEIDSVLFIDDAFEPLLNFEPTSEEALDLWTAIEADDDLIGLAAAIDIHGVGDLNSKIIVPIVESAGDDRLQLLFRNSEYVTHHQSKRQALETAKIYLTSAGLEVRQAGRGEWEDKLEGVKIVFLDWYLGDEGHEEAIKQASSTARKIHAAHKPLIVLISSDPSVKNHAAAFREASGLIGGLFDAMPKAWLADRAGIDLQMTALAEVFQKGHLVQAFIDTLQTQTAGAVTTFVNTVRQLTLSDYANLQHFALKKDGHPLGDYLTNLLSGLWADALFRGELKHHLAALDKEDFDRLPALTEPSSALGYLYNSAVFDMHVGDLSAHPHSKAAKDDQGELYISIGDIIVDEAGEVPMTVFAIVNPDCDLAISPKHNRTVAKDQSILLLPGQLVSIDHGDRTVRKELPDTPFFTLDETRFRIHWKITELLTVPYGQFSEWVKGKRRRATMRPLYILSLQQALYAHLTRVGLPTAPPMYDAMKAIVVPTFATKYLNEHQWETAQGRYLMARDSEDDQVVFTMEFAVKLKNMVVEGVIKLAGSDNLKDQKHAADIQAAMQRTPEWAALINPFKLTAEGAKFFGGAILVYREAQKPIEGAVPRKCVVCVCVQ